MKKFILILCASILLISKLSYADTQNAVDFNSFGPVKSLSVNGDFAVNIQQGDKQTIRVEASPEQRQQIQVSYKNNQLTISCKSTSFWSKSSCMGHDAKLFLTVKNLNSIDINGKSEVKLSHLSDHLAINNNGNMKLFTQGRFKVLAVNNHGKAVMNFNGSTNDFNLNSDGNLILNAEKMTANSFNSHTNGKAIMAVHANKTLDLSSNGEIILSYIGSPTITKTIHGKSIISPKVS